MLAVAWVLPKDRRLSNRCRPVLGYPQGQTSVTDVGLCFRWAESRRFSFSGVGVFGARMHVIRGHLTDIGEAVDSARSRFSNRCWPTLEVRAVRRAARGKDCRASRACQASRWFPSAAVCDLYCPALPLSDRKSV